MEAKELIEALGGDTAVARLTNVKTPSVWEWKQAGRIPENRLIRLALIAEARGIATRKALFPNDWETLWPELAGAGA